MSNLSGACAPAPLIGEPLADRVSPRGIQGRIQFDNSFCQISRNFSGLQAALAGLVLGSTVAGMKSVANRNLQGVPLDSDGAASYNRS